MLPLCKMNVNAERERRSEQIKSKFSFHIDYFLPGQKSSRDPWGGKENLEVGENGHDV